MCGSVLYKVDTISVCVPEQAAAYYLGMLAYYWVLATPSVGLLFGAYLYLSVNWFHVHYDEAFSSLQIPHHKGFSRIHVTPQGDLHVFGLAMDKVRTSCQGAEWCAPPSSVTITGDELQVNHHTQAMDKVHTRILGFP